MCYPHQIGGPFVRDMRTMRADLAQAQAHESGLTARIEQESFDALHCLPSDDHHSAFDAYNPQRMVHAKTASDFFAAYRKDAAKGRSVQPPQSAAMKRTSFESYDCMQWMKAEEPQVESDTIDQEDGSSMLKASQSVGAEPPSGFSTYRTKPMKSTTTCVLKKSKWRRRDIGKHLEGEKRRRKARMNRLYVLRDMLPKRSSKSTVNGILMDAIEYLQQSVTAEQRETMKKTTAAAAAPSASPVASAASTSTPTETPHATLRRGVEPAMVRSGILSSILFPSLLLDQHGNIVECSASLSNLIGYPCVLNDMPFMAMLHPEDANELAQRITIFQSWLTPADLITSHAAPIQAPLRTTVRLTNYSAIGVSTIPVDIEMLPVVQSNVNMMLVVVLNHPH